MASVVKHDDGGRLVLPTDEARRVLRQGQRAGRRWELLPPFECQGNGPRDPCRLRIATLVSARVTSDSRRPGLQVMARVEERDGTHVLLENPKPGRGQTVLFLDDLGERVIIRCPRGHDTTLNVGSLQQVADYARMSGAAKAADEGSLTG